MAVRLFVGGIRPLPPDNRPSGIAKVEVHGPLWLARIGLAGDQQADPRVHGGPDKALHQYPQPHYPRLALAFPDAAPRLRAGSIGENLSAGQWDETTVCIGDLFALGDTLIQVSQPRSPCWKIDARYAAEGMARWIDEQGATGWYFRVVEEGEVESGCRFELVERPAPAVTVARLLELRRDPRADAGELAAMAAAPGLSAGWVRKLRERIDWLAARR